MYKERWIASDILDFAILGYTVQWKTFEKLIDILFPQLLILDNQGGYNCNVCIDRKFFFLMGLYSSAELDNKQKTVDNLSNIINNMGPFIWCVRKFSKNYFLKCCKVPY